MSKNRLFLLLAFHFILILIIVYLIIRITAFLIASVTLTDKFLALFLLLAEFFTLLHAAGYFSGMIRRIVAYEKTLISHPIPALKEYPWVLIVVPSYKEPIEVLKSTLVCIYNIDYPNKFVVLLDDTRYETAWDTEERKAVYKKEVEDLARFVGVNLFRRKWRGAKAGIINDFIGFLNNKSFEDLSFFNFQGNGIDPDLKYLAIFDADMNPFPDFLRPLVSYLEINPKAAFIQTPQYYTNFERNRVARVAGLQQIVFFENICDGKGTHDSMFCCGTNALMRLKALAEVGGFDESTVTEDIATSFKLHCLGWQSLYFNKVGAFGLGPEDLGAYFKQQFRWALGTICILGPLLREGWQRRKHISFDIWFEYLLSASHYLIGWVFFTMFLFPILYLFFDVPSYFIDTIIYVSFFIPYIVLSMSLYFWSLRIGDMRRGDIFSTVVINAACFPVFMKAALYALFQKKSSFVVTPKRRGEPLPFRDLWAQTLASIVACMAATWGLHRLYYEREPFWGILINVVWTLINLSMISSFLYFNNPEAEEEGA